MTSTNSLTHLAFSFVAVVLCCATPSPAGEAKKPATDAGPGQTSGIASRAASDEARLMARSQEVSREIYEAGRRGFDEWRIAQEKGGRALVREFPDYPDGYVILFNVANYFADERARPILVEIIGSKVPEELKSRARATLRRLDAVGHPLELRFTAIDGREVDLQAMKGKVVMVEFWSTHCGPCVAEIPAVKAAYDKLHNKGFEIIGISFDSDKGELEQFIKDKALRWPQYFDGEWLENKFGVRWAVEGIPQMWLVDREGVLRDLNARDDLEAKVKNLLVW
jgi:thiol-disulfide isomerase/thioredoxin